MAPLRALFQKDTSTPCCAPLRALAWGYDYVALRAMPLRGFSTSCMVKKDLWGGHLCFFTTAAAAGAVPCHSSFSFLFTSKAFVDCRPGGEAFLGVICVFCGLNFCVFSCLSWFKINGLFVVWPFQVYFCFCARAKISGIMSPMRISASVQPDSLQRTAQPTSCGQPYASPSSMSNARHHDPSVFGSFEWI